MDARIAQLVCTEYGLGRALDWQPCSGTRNRNFNLATTTGRWFVRQRYSGYADPPRIAFDHRVLDFMKDHQVPVAALVEIPNRKGGSYLAQEGVVWEVFSYIDGEAFHEGDPRDAAALGNAVARFHAAGEMFAERYEKIAPRGETDPRTMLEQTDEIEKESPDAAPIVRQYRELVVEAQRLLPDAVFHDLPYTLIHGDLQPANVLMKAGQVAALVDLDWCAWRPRIYDLAFAILFCCATHETPIRGEDIWSLTQPPQVQPTLVETFLNAYESTGRPLTDSEHAALRPQIVLSWCHSRLAGALKVSAAGRSRFLDRPPHDMNAILPKCLAP